MLATQILLSEFFIKYLVEETFEKKLYYDIPISLYYL